MFECRVLWSLPMTTMKCKDLKMIFYLFCINNLDNNVHSSKL